MAAMQGRPGIHHSPDSTLAGAELAAGNATGDQTNMLDEPAMLYDPWDTTVKCFLDRFPKHMSAMQIDILARKTYIMSGCETYTCHFFDPENNRLNFRAEGNGRLESDDAVKKYALGVCDSGINDKERNEMMAIPETIENLMWTKKHFIAGAHLNSSAYYAFEHFPENENVKLSKARGLKAALTYPKIPPDAIKYFVSKQNRRNMQATMAYTVIDLLKLVPTIENQYNVDKKAGATRCEDSFQTTFYGMCF